MSTQWWALEPKMSGFGPQMGIACAFKSDLKGKVDESNGILLPVRGLLLFSEPNEHPRVIWEPKPEAIAQSALDVPSVFPM